MRSPVAPSRMTLADQGPRSGLTTHWPPYVGPAPSLTSAPDFLARKGQVPRSDQLIGRAQSCSSMNVTSSGPSPLAR